MSEPQDLMLLVWVHGFKGNDVTFESFPDRIVHLLQSTHPSLKVESHVFPMYQTRGELEGKEHKRREARVSTDGQLAATLSFVDWLSDLVVRLECNHGTGGGAGKARVVLMGHSMGGLLIADAARDIATNTRDGDSMWPRIVAVLAFDTPYLGLHPHTFKHGLSTAASYYEQARNIASAAGMLSPLAIGLGMGKWGKPSPAASSSSTAESSRSASPKTPTPSTSAVPSSSADKAPSKASSSWIPSLPVASTKNLYGLGAMALGAAALGTAYYRREDFLNGWKYGYEHMTFVRNLWDDEGMKGRLEGIDRLIKDRQVIFSNFYTHLPPSPPSILLTRTFCILPPTSHPLYPHFNPQTNTLATDEVSAHMGMFNPKTNDGFYDLGLAVVRIIAERIEKEGVGKSGEASLGAIEGWREEKMGDKTVWVEE